MMQRQVSFARAVVDAGIIDHDRQVGVFRFSGLRAILHVQLACFGESLLLFFTQFILC